MGLFRYLVSTCRKTMLEGPRWEDFPLPFVPNEPCDNSHSLDAPSIPTRRSRFPSTTCRRWSICDSDAGFSGVKRRFVRVIIIQWTAKCKDSVKIPFQRDWKRRNFSAEHNPRVHSRDACIRLESMIRNIFRVFLMWKLRDITCHSYLVHSQIDLDMHYVTKNK